MEASGWIGAVFVVLLMLLSLWLFFDVLGFTPGSGANSPH